MRAYKASFEKSSNIEHIMIIKDDLVYIIWGIYENLKSFYNFTRIDQFNVEDNKLIWEKLIRPNIGKDPKIVRVDGHRGQQRKMASKLYRNQNSFKIIELEQLLTHHNPTLRDFIRRLISNESL